MNFKAAFFGDYGAEAKFIDSDAKCNTAFGYEELYLTDESMEQLKAGKDLVVDIQGGEYVLRIMYDKGDAE